MVGLHKAPQSARRLPRLLVIVAAIGVLAPLLTVLRCTLTSTPSGSALSATSRPANASISGMAATTALTASVPSNISEQEQHLLDLVGFERMQTGCPELRLNSWLMASARAHAADMVGRAFARQTNPDHKGPDTRARKLGYRGAVSETLAVGLTTADEVFEQWTNPNNPASVPIRAKLNDCSRVSAGIAYRPERVRSTFGVGVWVLDLGDT